MALSKITTESLLDGEITLAKFANLGSDGQVMTSTGGSSPPAFEALPAGGATSKLIQASYDIATASGTVDYTSSSFGTAKAAIITACVSGAVGKMGVALMDQDGVAAGFYDGYGISANTWQPTEELVILQDGSNYVRGTPSVITDGIRITWAKASSPTGTALIKILLLK